MLGSKHFFFCQVRASVEVCICLMHTKAESFLGVKGAVKMLCVFCAREEKEKHLHLMRSYFASLIWVYPVGKAGSRGWVSGLYLLN